MEEGVINFFVPCLREEGVGEGGSSIKSSETGAGVLKYFDYLTPPTPDNK